MVIDEDNLIKLIKGELNIPYPVCCSEIPIGKIDGKIITVKVYSQKEAEHEGIDSPTAENKCIFL